MKEMRLAADRTGKALSQKPPMQIDNTELLFIHVCAMSLLQRYANWACVYLCAFHPQWFRSTLILNFGFRCSVVNSLPVMCHSRCQLPGSYECSVRER